MPLIGDFHHQAVDKLILTDGIIMENITVQKEFVAKTGPFRLGLIYSDIQIHKTPEVFIQKMNDLQAELVDRYTLDEVNKIETIGSIRKAYRSLGTDPNRYRPAADALIRRIVKGLGIYNINNVVDVLNFISIRDGYSISGFDREKIEGNGELGIGQKGEPYSGIGRGEMNICNLPVLRDRKGAFGTPTSDSERTMIGPEAKQILFVYYDFGNHSQLEYSMENCTELLINHCFAKETVSQVFQFN